MLSNRVFRLVTTALLLIGAFLVCMLYGTVFIQNERYQQGTLVFMPALLAFAVCLVNQICWDFLDVSFLNGKFGMKIKQILYFAILAISLLFACLVFGSEDKEFFLKESAFGVGICISSCLAPVVAAWCYLYVSCEDVDKEKLPFMPLIAMGISLVVGIVLGFFKTSEFMVNTLPILLAVLGAIGIVVHGFLAEWPFEDSSSSGSYKRSYSRSSSYSSSGSSYSSSGSSYKSSSSSSSGSRSYSSSSSSSSQNQDYRKKDGAILSEFGNRMWRICKNFSIMKDLGYGASFHPDVMYSRSSNSVTFTIGGKLYIKNSYAKDQYEVSQIKSEYERVLKDIANGLVSSASSEISSMRSEYQGFDGEFSIRTKTGYISNN